MLAEKRYAYDLSLPEKKVKVKEEREKFRLIKNITDSKINKKSKRTLITSTLCIFGMFMILTYRYNVISEKNFNVQKLSKNLETVTAELATTQIEVDRLMDINYVESYAKQQLGMQKPDKSQMVYVDMESKESVSKANSSSILKASMEKIKTVINDIF